VLSDWIFCIFRSWISDFRSHSPILIHYLHLGLNAFLSTRHKNDSRYAISSLLFSVYKHTEALVQKTMHFFFNFSQPQRLFIWLAIVIWLLSTCNITHSLIGSCVSIYIYIYIKMGDETSLYASRLILWALKLMTM